MAPQRQAASLQGGPWGSSQSAGHASPFAHYQHWSGGEGGPTDPVAHVAFLVTAKPEYFEDVRRFTAGAPLIDFLVHNGERIDDALARMARLEAQSFALDSSSFQL